jgi:hypothetical protein
MITTTSRRPPRARRSPGSTANNLFILQDRDVEKPNLTSEVRGQVLHISAEGGEDTEGLSLYASCH